jgi:hypothetical protein
MKALSNVKNLKGKIPKKGTKEYDFLIYFIQIIEGTASAFITRLGVNAATKDNMIKEILTWSISIALFIPCFFKFQGVEHIKAIAYGVFMEAINRTVMKRLEKTNFGLQYLSGDEVPISETEMNALLEKRMEEVQAARALQGNNEYPQIETYIEGEEEEEDNPDYLEGDETEVHDRIIEMRI